MCITSSCLHNHLRWSSGLCSLASHYTKGKLRLGELGQCPRSQNAGDLVLGSLGHSRKDALSGGTRSHTLALVRAQASSFARPVPLGCGDLSRRALVSRAWGG